MPPTYGPFKHGDPAHRGYNRTIGQNWPYIEDPEVDTVMYHPSRTFDSKQVWRDPTHGVSTPIKSIHDNFRNASKENSTQLMRQSGEFGTQIYTSQLVMASRKKQ